MNNQEIFPIDEQDEDVMVTVYMDNGDEVPCEILTIFEVNHQDYIALLPVDENGEPNQEDLVYIYRYQEAEDGTPSLENIMSDEEYELVEEYFDQLLDDEAFDQMS